MMGIGLWVMACALLAAWALAAYLACLALSRRVFVLMLVLCTVLGDRLTPAGAGLSRICYRITSAVGPIVHAGVTDLNSMAIPASPEAPMNLQPRPRDPHCHRPRIAQRLRHL